MLRTVPSRIIPVPDTDRDWPSLADTLLSLELVAADALSRAREKAMLSGRPLAEILRTGAFLSSDALAQAQAARCKARIVDLTTEPPDPRLVARMGAVTCMQLGLLPWRRQGGVTVMVAPEPDRLPPHFPRLEKVFGPLTLAIAPLEDIQNALGRQFGPVLDAAARLRTPESESCRSWHRRTPGRILALLCLVLAVVLLSAPLGTLTVLTLWAVGTLTLSMVLKAAALIASCRPFPPPPELPPDIPSISPLPVVSLLIPLYKEADVADRLIRRLSRLDYPPEQLDICFVTESDDDLTRFMLARADLPPWMRVITVPDGPLRTKPRALNYALDICRGSIIGIYDAEDAPETDQIRKVVRHFRSSPPDVVCLQAALDYYNHSQNWLARCFTAEYAGWFRVMMPGLSRLGLALPLGGTSLFIRRPALEALGAWDAYNVTEDADLGLRLARHGYRTAMLPSATHEEANCKLYPWVRQRSRWLKGYAMTWTTLMRHPLRLIRQLGVWQFLGVQVVLFCALSLFFLSPLLWSFWLLALGLEHPLSRILPTGALIGIGGLFALSEVLNVTIAAIGLRRAEKAWLWPWLPTLHLYFPLASLAAYKALHEMIFRPFYWDKTHHGLSDTTRDP
ncbi:glycosyltransferase family 2 protein [Rhodovulum imhoffii]|nr:glycosyltransferase family 2 protein [Rhodovulum imhoffii]